MAYPIKLKHAGESVIITVAKCGLAASGQYPEVVFTTDEDEQYSVPQVSCDRQLTRLAMTYADCVGKIMTISRAPNGKDASKPFWNLDVNGKADLGERETEPLPKGRHQPFHQPSPPSEADDTPTDQQGRFHYQGITAWVIKEIVPMYVAKGITLDMVAIAAIVNTNAIREIR